MFSFILQIGNKIQAKLAIQDRKDQLLEYTSATISSIVISKVKPVETYVYKTYQGFVFQDRLQDNQLADALKIAKLSFLVSLAVISLLVFLIKIAYLDIDVFVNQIAEIGMQVLFICSVYKGLQLYSIRFNVEAKLNAYFLSASLIDYSYSEIMNKIKSIFSSRLITHKEKVDLIMGLKFNSLDDSALNIFGFLIESNKIQLIRDVFRILPLNTSQKFRLLMAPDSSSSSSLLMATTSLNSFIANQEIIHNGIIIPENDQLNDQLNAHMEIVEFLIQESEVFSDEQRLLFLTQADEQNNTPLRNLRNYDSLKAKFVDAIKNCKGNISLIGGVLYQLAHQKDLPTEVVKLVMEFSMDKPAQEVLNYSFDMLENRREQMQPAILTRAAPIILSSETVLSKEQKLRFISSSTKERKYPYLR